MTAKTSPRRKIPIIKLNKMKRQTKAQNRNSQLSQLSIIQGCLHNRMIPSKNNLRNLNTSQFKHIKTMPEWKRLYIGKSVKDLQKKASIGSHEVTKIKQIVKDNGEQKILTTMNKCLSQHKEYKELGDQEICYIYLLKFIEMYSLLQGMDIDKKFFNAMIGAKVVSNCMKELENLDTDLRARYKEVEKGSSEKIEMSNNIFMTNNEFDPIIDEMNSDVDFDKIKKFNNINYDKRPKTDSIFISCKELKELLDSPAPSSVLVIDVRSEQEFQSRVKTPKNINIPNHIIKPGESAAILEKKLSEEAKHWWVRREEFQNVVLIDKDTNSDRYKHGIPIHSMREILTQWDFPVKCKNPLILNNGFDAWSENYPNFTINPGYNKIFFCIDAQPSTVTLNDIEYPDSDDDSRNQNKRIAKINGENVPVEVPVQDIDTESIFPLIPTADSPILHPTSPILSPACPIVDRSSKPIFDQNNVLNPSRKPLKTIHDSITNITLNKDSTKENHMMDDGVNNMDQSYQIDTCPELGKKEDHSPMIVENGSSKETWKADPEITHVGLKSDSNSASSPGLKKSLSSPNISQLDDDMEVLISKPTPKFDRSNKPRYIHQIESPRHGYQDKQYRGSSQGELEGAIMGANIVRGLTGLKNLGNTCYMNSILQCISNTTALREELCRNVFNASQRSRSSKSKTEGLIAREMQKVIQMLWIGTVKSFSCYELKNAVGRFRNSFKGCEQQDSHEFFTILMDWLHEDLNEPLSNCELSGAVEETGEKAWGEFRKNNNSIVLDLFYGQQKSTVKCDACGKQSLTFEPFSNLSLLLPSNEESCTLSDCMELYFKQECITGWNCPQCKTPQNATKKVDITRLPPVLVIHFKRFTTSGWCRKKQTNVNFPLLNFDLRPYTAKNSEQRNEVYNLYAVSNHYGTMEGGHYTACCFNTELSRWYRFDDQDVSDISSSDVKTSAAYILFYSANR